MGDIGQQAAPAWQTEAISGFARSELFDRTFKEGMDLVEETAAYLDGAGRQDSKLLSRSAALAYAAESMRLTTRLMQLASWLLLHRAVNEGEMSLLQASQEKTKVKLSPADSPDEEMARLLPQKLRDLIARSLKLLERVRRLDATIHAGTLPKSSVNPVERQVGLLRAAFERDPR
jgi:regulator of CtrA degradation